MTDNWLILRIGKIHIKTINWKGQIKSGKIQVLQNKSSIF